MSSEDAEIADARREFDEATAELNHVTNDNPPNGQLKQHIEELRRVIDDMEAQWEDLRRELRRLWRRQKKKPEKASLDRQIRDTTMAMCTVDMQILAGLTRLEKDAPGGMPGIMALTRMRKAENRLERLLEQQSWSDPGLTA